MFNNNNNNNYYLLLLLLILLLLLLLLLSTTTTTTTTATAATTATINTTVTTSKLGTPRISDERKWHVWTDVVKGETVTCALYIFLSESCCRQPGTYHHCTSSTTHDACYYYNKTFVALYFVCSGSMLMFF